jgi:hypothetical protein
MPRNATFQASRWGSDPVRERSDCSHFVREDSGRDPGKDTSRILPEADGSVRVPASMGAVDAVTMTDYPRRSRPNPSPGPGSAPERFSPSGSCRAGTGSGSGRIQVRDAATPSELPVLLAGVPTAVEKEESIGVSAVERRRPRDGLTFPRGSLTFPSSGIQSCCLPPMV